MRAGVYIDPNNHSVKPIIINDRTMLPLRFVAESLGCDVGWVNDTRTITITYQSLGCDVGWVNDTRTITITYQP